MSAAAAALALCAAGCDEPTGKPKVDSMADVLLRMQFRVRHAADVARQELDDRAVDEARAKVATVKESDGAYPETDGAGANPVPLGERYALRRDENGGWTVYDTATGEVAARNSVELSGLSQRDAAENVSRLNQAGASAEDDDDDSSSSSPSPPAK
jgi:hypothetical protein